MGVASAVMNDRASDRAVDAETRANEQAVAEQRRQFDIIQQNQAPWQQTGVSALNQLASMFGLNTGEGGGAGDPDMSGFFESPDYRYAMDQSQRAIERSAAQRGGLNSGGTLAALQRNASGLASQNYSGYVNRLASLAGVGQSANSTLANAGLQTGNNISNLFAQSGQARAGGILGSQAAQNQSRGNTMGYMNMFFGGG